MSNYIDTLFGHLTEADIAAGKAAHEAEIAADVARIAAVKARDVAIEAEKAANRCPKCFGAGYLPHFMHRKNGECFTCNGSGIFRKYAA